MRCYHDPFRDDSSLESQVELTETFILFYIERDIETQSHTSATSSLENHEYDLERREQRGDIDRLAV